MLRVHVVEDDPSIAMLVRHELESEGFMSVISVDIQGSWDMLLSEKPDAAIIDLGLARGDSGWDLIKQIRSSPRFEDLPILILTGQPADQVLDRAREYSCEYLAKPFSSAALLDRLHVAMRGVGRAPKQRPVEVIILAHGYRIEGTVHVPAELVRFSDAWEAVIRDPREFFPVTNARVHGVGEVGSGTSAEFIQVRKADAVVAFERAALRE